MPSRNRGNPRPKLRDLSRKWPTYEEKSALLDHLASSDAPIVTAVLGAALLEQEIERMLRPRFRRQDDDTWKELTSDNGPLGTFNLKIMAGYAFGTYDDTIKDGLNTVRAIRNVFAHTKKLLDFSDELIINELNKVCLPKQKRSIFYKDLSHYVRDATGDPQQRYKDLCFILDTELLAKRTRNIEAKLRRLKAKTARLKRTK